MKRLLCSCSVLAVLPSATFARLGETEQQLVARFGAPTSRVIETMSAQGKVYEFGVKLRFRQDDWSIECAIVDGRSSREIYQKVGEWTDEQMTTVLNSNSQGARWTDLSRAATRKIFREWRRNDGGVATWSVGTMTVTHPSYERAKKVVEAKAKASSSRPPNI